MRRILKGCNISFQVFVYFTADASKLLAAQISLKRFFRVNIKFIVSEFQCLCKKLIKKNLQGATELTDTLRAQGFTENFLEILFGGSKTPCKLRFSL
jgi:hypothetical protein